MKKHWVSNAFCYILELSQCGRGVYEFKFKMDHIYSTQHFDSIHFICDLWSLFIFHLSKMVTEPKKE